MTDLSLYRQLVDGSVFADPTEPDYTVRFKTTSAPKSVSGQKTTNYITEIIINDNNDVTVGGVGAVDPVSVRVRVSGCLESQARVNAIVTSVAGQLSAWAGEHVLTGFLPTTKPLVVV